MKKLFKLSCILLLLSSSLFAVNINKEAKQAFEKSAKIRQEKLDTIFKLAKENTKSYLNAVYTDIAKLKSFAGSTIKKPDEKILANLELRKKIYTNKMTLLVELGIKLIPLRSRIGSPKYAQASIDQIAFAQIFIKTSSKYIKANGLEAKATDLARGLQTAFAIVQFRKDYEALVKEYFKNTDKKDMKLKKALIKLAKADLNKKIKAANADLKSYILGLKAKK